MPRRKRKAAPRKHPAPPATERFNMVLDPDLKSWAVDYAERNRTTITALVIQHLVELKDRDEGPYVEQI
jgi:hypothetical protein